MKTKTIVKLIIDLLMTIALMLLMSYQMIGERNHELIGVGMFALFISHQVLNGKWYSYLLKGKYTIIRTFQTILNFLILLSMMSLMVSGIILSRYVFSFLSLTSGQSFARTLHLLASYWGFVLMSVHLGFHWSVIIGAVKSMIKKTIAPMYIRAFRILAIFIAVYGVYAFFKRNIGSYMLLKVQFVFFDVSEPIIFFLLDYLAIMGLFVFAGYYFIKSFRKFSINNKNKVR